MKERAGGACQRQQRYLRAGLSRGGAQELRGEHYGERLPVSGVKTINTDRHKLLVVTFVLLCGPLCVPFETHDWLVSKLVLPSEQMH